MILAVVLFVVAWACLAAFPVALCVIAKRSDQTASRAIEGWRNGHV